MMGRKRQVHRNMWNVEGTAWPGRCEIYLRPDIFSGTCLYPITQTYKKQAGPLTYNSFYEHLVAVAAHELRHVDQFSMPYAMRKKLGHHEVDAERFAAFVLSRWRKEGELVVSNPALVVPDAPPPAAAVPESATCPRCQVTGLVAERFGYRTISGVRRRQSYCKGCRNTRKAPNAQRSSPPDPMPAGVRASDTSTVSS
jgi:hypothetical protein